MSVQNYRVCNVVQNLVYHTSILLFVFCVHEKIVPVFYLKMPCLWSSHCAGARDRGHAQI